MRLPRRRRRGARRVERGGLVAGRGLTGLERLLDAAAHRIADLADRASVRAASRGPPRSSLAAQRERALLQIARHMQSPALVAERALELAEDRRRRVARELGSAAGLEAVDRLDQPEAGDLHEVVERLVGVAVAEREVAGERDEALDQLVAGSDVAVAVVAHEELRSALRACSRWRSSRGRSAPRIDYGWPVGPVSQRPVRGRLRYARRGSVWQPLPGGPSRPPVGLR